MRERLTIYEVATLLGVSTATIYRWTNEGVLPRPERDGRRVFWNAQRMIAWASDAYPERDFTKAAEGLANL